MPAHVPAPPAPRRHRIDLQVRFGDTDALGHVNNASFAAYAEVGRLAFVRSLGTAVRSLILAHLALDFRRQVPFDAPLAVETWVERVGTTSVTLRQAILAGDAVAAEVRSVVVAFDYAAQRPTAWDAAARAAFAAFEDPPAFAAAPAAPGAG